MKIDENDLLIKYGDVQIDKTFHMDGSITLNVIGHKNCIEEVVDLLLARNKFNHEINQIKSKNKNYINYNILFKNKIENKQDTHDLTEED